MDHRTAPIGAPSVPTVFAVVGEKRDDPDRLLVLGEDGRHYQYQLPVGTTTPVVPDDGWVIDPDPPPADEVTG
jgi:hypothetical protein